MSWRRLRVVLDHLPPESAYLTSVREAMTPEDWQRLDEEPRTTHGPWSQADYLLADLRDWVARLAWMQSDGKTPAPPPYPRPGVDLSNVRGITADVEAYLREVERLHGAHPTDWRPPSEEATT